MIDLFSKLSQLQALGYAVGLLRSEISSESCGDFTRRLDLQILRDKERQILDLQYEIIDMVNNLNGKKVY